MKFLDLFKGVFDTKDNKPMMLSLILQQDHCSRLLGEFAEKHLHECSKLVIVWQNGSSDVKAVHSDSLDAEGAAKLLIKAQMLIAGGFHE